jgi:hypothetical protein
MPLGDYREGSFTYRGKTRRVFRRGGTNTSAAADRASAPWACA